MTLINDYYGIITQWHHTWMLLNVFGFIFVLIWLIFAIKEDHPLQGFFAWLILVGSILSFGGAIHTYHQAVFSVEHALEERGYKIVDDFPNREGSTFTAEKDGEILYCQVGFTFDGGNSVRIECKG